MTGREKMVRDAELVFNRLMPKLPGGATYTAEVVDGEDGHPVLTVGGMTIESGPWGKDRLWNVFIEAPDPGGRDDPPTTSAQCVVPSAESFSEALVSAVTWHYREAAEILLSDQAMADQPVPPWEPPTEE
jgi:hypothetical protein